MTGPRHDFVRSGEWRCGCGAINEDGERCWRCDADEDGEDRKPEDDGEVLQCQNTV